MAPKKKSAKTSKGPQSTAEENHAGPKDEHAQDIDDTAAKNEAAPEEPSSVHQDDDANAKAEPDVKDDSKPSKKRKKNANDSPDQRQKVARRSGRGGRRAEPTQEQLLNYLISKDAEELCRPPDETDALKQHTDLRTYSASILNPFEELMCAVILSRPISHRLGIRSIRTVLNAPYNFTSAKAVQDAGAEKRHQALSDAKTQHKGKTADEIGMLADVTLEKFTTADDEAGTRLQKALDDCDGDIDDTLDLLKQNIKGLGKTGLEIFLRRVQWLWPASFPYADLRSSSALKQLGLPYDAADLQEAIESHWSKLRTEHLAGEDDEARKRRAFVVVLERVTGAELEGQAAALLEAAATL